MPWSDAENAEYFGEPQEDFRDPAPTLLDRLRQAEADYTVTWGSGDLYGEAADALDAARRLWPLIERSTKGLVFTADRAGEVAADMAALRKALVA